MTVRSLTKRKGEVASTVNLAERGRNSKKVKAILTAEKVTKNKS